MSDTVTIFEFIDKLKEALELPDENITPETNIRDIAAWNSMNALILIAMFETEFDVTLSGDDLRDCNTVQDMYGLLNKTTI